MSLLYKVFGLLLKEACVQCNVDWAEIYQFFTDVVNSLRFVYSTYVQDASVYTITTYMQQSYISL